LPYVIDTNALIDGRRRIYPPTVFSGLWENFEDSITAGDIFAPDEVLIELEKQDDAVHDWVCTQSGLFIPLDDDIQISVAEVLAAYPEWIPADRSRNMADAFVVALARVKGCPVVSNEKWTDSPYAHKIKLPNVCDGMGVPYMNFLAMLHDLGWTFPRC
jgi:Domain of unknown function (DUF4411)